MVSLWLVLFLGKGNEFLLEIIMGGIIFKLMIEYTNDIIYIHVSINEDSKNKKKKNLVPVMCVSYYY